MSPADLQGELARLGTYKGRIDGQFGPVSKAALVVALSSGPASTLGAGDITAAAGELDVAEAAIRAVWAVEAGGCGFQGGRPKILPEPHRFSVLTRGRFDASDPDLSWPVWTPGRYPASQAARYAQLADMTGLDVDAGLSACSYGAFQILGENAGLCGYTSPWAFAHAMSLGEAAHLRAFVGFVRARGLDKALRLADWRRFAMTYNGPGQVDAYALKLAQAYGQALVA